MIWEAGPTTKFGYISRTHGYKGALRIEIQAAFAGQLTLNEKESVYVEIDQKPVPFFVAEIQQENNRFIVVQLLECATQSAAEKLIGCSVWIKSDPKNKATPNTPHFSIIGFELVDTQLNTIGKITEITERPGQPLLTIDTGKKTFYVPWAEELIKSIVEENQQIIFELPEGLADL